MADPVGRFNVAFDQPSLTWEPTWTRLDNTDNLVASYTIDRGRQYELDTTDTGTATVEITDRDGVLDPTNPAGPYYGKIEPALQAVIQRWNPVSGEWRQRFRGFIDDLDYVFDPSQQVNKLVVSLVDLFERLSAIELVHTLFGDNPSTESVGQVVYNSEPMDSRIERLLDHALIPDDFYVVFSGNVQLYKSVYSAGELVLTAVQEAADAEFPGVSNVYVDRRGRVCVHGRYAKFNAEEVAGATTSDVWDFNTWKVGDSAAVDADATHNTVQIRRFGFQRGQSKIINSALATPWQIADNKVDNQRVEDVDSRLEHGVRSWSAQQLLTKSSLYDGASALVETKRFATYYVENYKQPKNRVTEIGFRTTRPDAANAARSWAFLSRVDISDAVEVTIDSPGGGGFNAAQFFVEGVHETARPLNPTYDDIEVTLDLSPRSYFDTDPWA